MKEQRATWSSSAKKSATYAATDWKKEFLPAVPNAAQVLGASELRAWGDMGRRLAMSDVETAVTFFNFGVAELKDLAPDAQAILFQLCSRQMSLANIVATRTLRSVPEL